MSYSQITNVDTMSVTSPVMKDFNQTCKLKMNEVINFPDGLTLKLYYFSHKKVYEGQISPEIAHLSFSKNNNSIELSLRKHYSQEEDGKIISIHYETKIWEKYEIQLKELSYDEYIEIVVIPYNKD